MKFRTMWSAAILVLASAFLLSGCNQLLSVLGTKPDVTVGAITFSSVGPENVQATIGTTSISTLSVNYAIILATTNSGSGVTLSSGPEVYSGSASVPASATKTVTITPSDLDKYVSSNSVNIADGSYYLDVIVNPKGTIAESNTANDVAVSPSKVTVSSGSFVFRSSSGSPPGVPTGLSISNPSGTSQSSLTVSWNAIASASSYTLYRDTSSSGSFSTIVGANLTTTTVTDTGLSAGTTYYYEVEAANSSGSSGKSTAASGLTVPAVPAGLSVSSPSGTSATTSLSISWNASTGATAYNLYRDTSSSGTFSTVVGANLTSTSYNDTSLTPGTNYYYEVEAVNAAGSSGKSPAASSATGLSVPTGLSVGGITASSVSVSWNALVGASSYNLYRDTSSSGSFSTAVGTNLTSTSSTVSGLSAGTTYYFEVEAVNATGSSGKSAPVSALTLPAAPTGLSVAQSTATPDSALSISWSAVTGATGYTLYRDTSSTGSFSTVVGSNLTNPSVNDSGLASGTTYYYEVEATNASGSSSTSSPVSGTTAGPPPPTNLAVSCTTDTGTGVSTCTISWQAPVGTSVAGYSIYRSTTNSFSSSSTAKIYGTKGTSYSDTGVTQSITYYYWVTSQNTAGPTIVESTPAGPVSGTP